MSVGGSGGPTPTWDNFLWPLAKKKNWPYPSKFGGPPNLIFCSGAWKSGLIWPIFHQKPKIFVRCAHRSSTHCVGTEKQQNISPKRRAKKWPTFLPKNGKKLYYFHPEKWFMTPTWPLSVFSFLTPSLPMKFYDPGLRFGSMLIYGVQARILVPLPVL